MGGGDEEIRNIRFVRKICVMCVNFYILRQLHRIANPMLRQKVR